MSTQSSLYLDYFGLTSEPFGLTPDPRYFFDSPAHVESLARVLYAIEQKEMALVLGAVGTGKTLISRCLVDALDENQYRLAWIINPSYSPVRFLQEICAQLFGSWSGTQRAQLMDQIQEGMLDLYQANVYPVIIIDEAQEIKSKQTFDDIRLLSNFQADACNLISVVFLGQLELLKRLKRLHYRSLFERIRYVVQLQPFDQTDTAAYIRHRLRIAGSQQPEIFEPEAITLIFKLTQGFPRRINHLAAFSLLEAMSTDQTVVTPEIVKRAASEIPYLQA